PVGSVLVPGDVGGVAGLLEKEARAPAKDVWPEDVLDGIQDDRVSYQRVEPGEDQVALVAELAAQRPTLRGLDGLEAPPVPAGLVGRQHPDGEVEAVTVVPLEGRRRQKLQHRPPSILTHDRTLSETGLSR